MALIVRTGAIQEAERAASALKADRPLWLTADRRRVVEGETPEAAYLFTPRGEPIGVAEAQQYGLRVVDGRIVLPESPAT